MDETDKLEKELKEVYNVYCRKLMQTTGLEQQIKKMQLQLEEVSIITT